MSGRRLPSHGRPRAILGLCDAKIPAVKLSAIELLDSVYSSSLVREPDESEPPRATGDPVNRQKHLGNVSYLCKQAGEFALGSVKTEVSNEDF
jgi:hypothetical protein